MKQILKKSGTVLYYLSGIVIIGALIYSIGIKNIYETLSTAKLNYIYWSILISILASLLRVYKLSLLLTNHSAAQVLELFVFARIGKELSFAGYFLPMAKKNNRNIDTIKNLVIDRYTEIFSTVIIGLIALLTIFKTDSLHIFLVAILGGATLLLLAIPFLPTKSIFSRFKSNIVKKISEIIDSLQGQLNVLKARILFIYFLSIVSTCLDFLTAHVLLLSLSVQISYLIIPVVWASSGLVSILGFMIIGTTEVSVVYLYEKLASLATAVTASFIFISRIINILSILILLMLHLTYVAIIKLKFSKAKAYQN